MRFLKISLCILFLVVGIGLLAAACLILFLDPNRLKPVLIEQVRNQTGYVLAIDGELGWSFYPRIGIDISHMTLQSPGKVESFVDLTDFMVATDLMELLRGREKLEGDVYAEELSFANLHAQQVSANIRWENKTLTVGALKGSLYSGSVAGEMHGGDFAVNPRWDWDFKFDHIKIEDLLKDLEPANKIVITGLGMLKFQASTAGKQRVEVFNNLNGTLTFSLNTGTIQGIDMNHLVRTADALLNNEPLPPADLVSQTAFNSLTGTALIKNGIASSNNLLLLSPTFITRGQGTVTLLSKEIQFTLGIKPQQDLRTQWEIPLDITGTLDKPEINLDMAEIGKLLAKEGLKKIKEKAGSFLNSILSK